MRCSRRHFLRLTGGIIAVPRIARAQSYPARPVRVVVPYAAGGPNDILARLMGQWLSQQLGQSFVVENRPGGGGNTATEQVVNAVPDGYTLLQVGTGHAINATLFPRLNFNFIRDIAPIAAMVRQPQIMMVNPSVPATTVPEFIAYAKRNPSKLNMASSGIGTGPHLAGELFKMMTGIDMVHVPYRSSGPAITDLIAGQVQVAFIGPISSLDHIKNGRLRALGVSTAKRWSGLPDLPVIADSVPGYEASGWFGFGAPAKIPADIVGLLNKEINAGLRNPTLNARLVELGAIVIPGSSTDFATLIAAETEKWGKVVKFAGITAG